MDIIEFTQENALDLIALYNRAVKQVPHCYPVQEESFKKGIGDPCSREKDDPLLESQTTFTAYEEGTLLGFITLGIQPPIETGSPKTGMIRFFWHETGFRHIGQGLLNAAEEYAREQGVKEMCAFHSHYTFKFYQLDSSRLSDHLGHVGALLGLNGYERTDGEVIFSWSDFIPPPLETLVIKADIVTEWKKTEGKRSELTVKAMHNNDQIGECECRRIGDYTDCQEVSDWLFVKWLGVNDEFQGKRLGKYLLSYALKKMHSAGYRHACISTGWDNYRAAVFYSNFGFHMVDWTYGLKRSLS